MPVQLFDTHCHIQESAPLKPGQDDKDHTNKLWSKLGYPTPAELVREAAKHHVTGMMVVGCDLRSSEQALVVAADVKNTWASIGIHPHEAQRHLDEPTYLERFAALAADNNVKAIGECGLDYFYAHSPKEAQAKILRFQLDLAQKHDLPLVFHVREAFDDFWPIFDEYKGLRGVLHSFTDTSDNLQKALERGLYVGVNGIMTFTKDASQLEMVKRIPTDRMVLETDAPYLTPAPYRGTICEPKHVRVTAEFLAELRSESLPELAAYTTQNAHTLFDLKR